MNCGTCMTSFSFYINELYLLSDNAAIDTSIFSNQFKWVAQCPPYYFSPNLMKVQHVNWNAQWFKYNKAVLCSLLFQMNQGITDFVFTFCSSFSSVSLMASTLAASRKRVHPPPTTIPSSTAACEGKETILVICNQKKIQQRMQNASRSNKEYGLILTSSNHKYKSI